MGVINVLDKNKFLMELLRYLIVVVFFISATMKIADFFNTSYFFGNTFGFSITTVKYLLLLLISIELFLGLAIITRVNILQIIYSMTVILLFVFILIEIGFIYKGIDNCGCFGTVWKMNPIASIIKTVVLIFTILILKRNLVRETNAS
jgi:hypothetical protein